ncbi:uncharacterized protein ARMOST_13644 [Armillaria ostoyae]|uniref:Uncharacterized protein n=1 Tax=Armillaria ostoyae TaxID=47428 RepID=A0A284RNC1_ARMOS|nr:uncharacterized protein ARMOST_13644 [Armillaria ostoyae]
MDDSAPVPEKPFPDATKLMPEEFVKAMEDYKAHQHVVKSRVGQIERWLRYHDDLNKNAMARDTDNPYNFVLASLTGHATQKPRRRTAYNLWCKLYGQEVEDELQKMVDRGEVSEKQKPGKRQSMRSDCYNALPDEEKKEWMKRSEDEHTAALAEWEANKNRKASSDPIEIQKCIHNLSQFMHPILDQVAKATNGKLTLLWGGPEPIDGGHLNVISICSGKTLGHGGQNFVDSEKVLYRKVIEPMYARFLKKCYCPEDCQAMALPDNAGLKALEELGLGLKEYEAALADEVEGPNTVRSKASSPSTSSSSTVTSTKPPKGNKSTVVKATKPSGHSGRPSSLPTLSQLLASKSATVAKTGATVPAQIQPASRPPLLAPSLTPSSPPPSRPATPLAASQLPSPLISPPPLLASLLVTSEVASNLTASSRHLAQPSVNTDEAQAPKDTNVAPISTLDSICKPNRFAGVVPSHTVQGRSAPGLRTGQLSIKKRLAGDDPCDGGVTKRRKADGQGDDGPKKKGLKNTVKEPVGAEEPVPLLASIVFPSSAPPWAIKALEMFKSHSFGPDWSQVVYSWVAFQVTNDFDSDDKLSAEGRPECVGQWIARARSQKWRPTYANLDIVSKFQEPFWTWWANLQPEDCVGGSEDGIEDLEREPDGCPVQIHPSTDVNWECLKTHSGKNGLVSVMAALFFWSAGVEALPQTMHHERARYNEAQKELMFAMGDVLYALQSMLV